MIVIFTSRDDQSTNEVIDWLYHFKAKFIRVNEDDVISQSVVSGETRESLLSISGGLDG
jgi:hypothetical protein